MGKCPGMLSACNVWDRPTQRKIVLPQIWEQAPMRNTANKYSLSYICPNIVFLSCVTFRSYIWKIGSTEM
jgi:hypothetical protein